MIYILRCSSVKLKHSVTFWIHTAATLHQPQLGILYNSLFVTCFFLEVNQMHHLPLCYEKGRDNDGEIDDTKHALPALILEAAGQLSQAECYPIHNRPI